MEILNQEINEEGLRQIKFTYQPGLGNVEQVWCHPDGLTLYKILNSPGWHVKTSFSYPSINYHNPIQTFEELRQIYILYLQERQKEINRWK